MSKHASQMKGYSEVRLPLLEPYHHRCACGDAIPCDKWKDHAGSCMVRIRKREERKAKKAAA